MKHKNESVPDFIIIGAAKSGTTTLYNDLKTSNLLNLPYDKEPAILLKAKSKEQAIKQYSKHFKKFNPNVIKGEGTTRYMMTPEYPDISRFALNVCGKDLKIIVILRDPIERIISHVTHDYIVGRLKDRNIDNAINENNIYIHCSNYYMQLKPWVDLFGLNNIHCISFKKYIKNRNKMSQEAAQFIGIDRTSLTYREEISNASSNLKRNILPKNMMAMYNVCLRNFTPVKIRRIGFNLLSKKPSICEVQFSRRLKNDLGNNFAMLDEKLFNLLQKKIEW